MTSNSSVHTHSSTLNTSKLAKDMMKTALCVAAAVLGTLVICLIQDVAASP
ncbi:hypothetical protein scyTo_0024116, partial [Scyliorhinus torazame]|nr:hypothetical protein [Scyliorhinus torazame]